MGKTIYIHIGSHKTGTTSIQKSLVAHKDYLIKNNIVVFHGPSDLGNIHSWVVHNVGKGGKAYLKDGLTEKLGKINNDVLISSEGFSYFFDKEDISELVASLHEYFSKVVIIAYIRRQDMQVVSHHQQGSKGIRTPAYRIYGSSPRAIPDYRESFDEYLDYNERLGKWADIVGDENMRIRLFERESLIDGDAVADFFSVLGLEKQVDLPRENESNGFIRTKVGHLINRLRIPERLIQPLRDRLDNSGKMIPGRADAEAFYARYVESNRKLNERFKISDSRNLFLENFDSYPAQPQDVWDEDKANRAILEILEEIGNVQGLGTDELAVLRKCEAVLKSNKSSHAKRFSKLADKIEANLDSNAGLTTHGLANTRGIIRKTGRKLLDRLGVNK